MDLTKKKWSFSSVKCFEQCPYAFYLKYIQDEVEEENAFDNLTEGLQQTMRGEQMEENVSEMEEAIDKIDEVIECLDNIE